MTFRTVLWVTLVALTTLLPGLTIGLLGKSRRWPAKRCRRASFLFAFCFWIVCGFVAQFVVHTIPWGWIADAPMPRILAQVVWYAAVLAAPFVAVKIAFPDTKLSDMAYW